MAESSEERAKLANALCSYLGLDETLVQEISFQWSPGDVGRIAVKIAVKFMLSREQWEAFATVLKSYQLVEKEKPTISEPQPL